MDVFLSSPVQRGRLYHSRYEVDEIPSRIGTDLQAPDRSIGERNVFKVQVLASDANAENSGSVSCELGSGNLDSISTSYTMAQT